MLDSPIALILLGLSAASTIASFAARRRRSRPTAAALATLSDQELLATLTSLQSTNASFATEQHASRAQMHSISAVHSASKMREANHPKPASWVSEQDAIVRRRLTLLIIEELERRQQ